MTQQWLTVLGLALDFAGFMLLLREWWLAFFNEERQIEMEEQFERVRALRNFASCASGPAQSVRNAGACSGRGRLAQGPQCASRCHGRTQGHVPAGDGADRTGIRVADRGCMARLLPAVDRAAVI